MRLFSLLHGRRPHWLDIVGAHFFAAFLTGYILVFAQLDPPFTYGLALLVWWQAASLVSHATEATRTAWRALNSNLANALLIFGNIAIVLGVTVWPFRLLPEDPWSVIFINMMMLAKIMVFVAGQRRAFAG